MAACAGKGERLGRSQPVVDTRRFVVLRAPGDSWRTIAHERVGLAVIYRAALVPARRLPEIHRSSRRAGGLDLKRARPWDVPPPFSRQ